MRPIQLRTLYLNSVAIIAGLFNYNLYAIPPLSPCSNTTSIFTFINRPNNADNACTVPFKKALFEMGYQYSDVTNGGDAQNFPQLTLHIGLPLDSELIAIMPNYNIQSVSPHTGFNATTLGLKHEVAYEQNWILSIEGYVTPPSGGNNFGSDDTGGTLNGIFSYNFTPSLNITAMIGISTQTQPTNLGGQRYNSINPNLVLSWQINERFQTYGELFGQSQTAPEEGAGFNFDAGILYLLRQNIEIDAEIGRRLTGSLGGYNTYIGMGIGILL